MIETKASEAVVAHRAGAAERAPHAVLPQRGLDSPEASYAPRPTRTTLFFRTFLPWQAIRFVVINLKMLGIIARSHRG